MRLSEPIETPGYFWLPNAPDQKLGGMLRVSETGKTTVDVFGAFGGPGELLANPSVKRPRILGVTENDRVTLDDCLYTAKTMRFGTRLSTSTIHAGTLLRGAHYDEGKTITFSRLQFSVDGLDEWLHISGFRVDHRPDEGRATISFENPKDIICDLSDGMALTFGFHGKILNLPLLTEATITQKAFITLTSKVLRPLDQFVDIVRKLNNFLCFVIDETVSIDSLTGYSSEVVHTVRDNDQYELPMPIYYESLPSAHEKPKITNHHMLLGYYRIVDSLTGILRAWLNHYEVLGPAFDLYFASKRIQYLDTRFLLLAQAIETLHRRNSPGTFMPDGQFQELIQTIMKACPREHEKWLTEKVRYANELSLRKRLQQMLDPFRSYYGDPKKIDSLISRVVDTRNYLTHYDERLVGRALQGKALWDLCGKLEGVLQLHFLRLMGLDETVVSTISADSYSLREKLQI